MSNINHEESSENADNRTEKRKTGDLGEEVACIYLKKLGYKIVERNYLRKYGEIDIVAKKGSLHYFIEVKSVTHETFGGYRPEENVHPWKLQRLRRVIQAYILEKKVVEDWEFAVITVFLNMKTRRASVSFMENLVL